MCVLGRYIVSSQAFVHFCCHALHICLWTVVHIFVAKGVFPTCDAVQVEWKCWVKDESEAVGARETTPSSGFTIVVQVCLVLHKIFFFWPSWFTLSVKITEWEVPRAAHQLPHNDRIVQRCSHSPFDISLGLDSWGKYQVGRLIS